MKITLPALALALAASCGLLDQDETTPADAPEPLAVAEPPGLSLDSTESADHQQLLTVRRGDLVIHTVEAAWDDAQLDTTTGLLSYAQPLDVAAPCPEPAGHDATAWLAACWPAVVVAHAFLADTPAPTCACDPPDGEASLRQPTVTVRYTVRVLDDEPTPEPTGVAVCVCDR